MSTPQPSLTSAVRCRGYHCYNGRCRAVHFPRGARFLAMSRLPAPARAATRAARGRCAGRPAKRHRLRGKRRPPDRPASVGTDTHRGVQPPRTSGARRHQRRLRHGAWSRRRCVRSGGVSHYFATLESRLQSFPQLAKTGRPEALARGNHEDVTLTASDLPTQAVLSRAARRWGRSHCRQQGVAADGPGSEEKKAGGFPIRRHRSIQ